MAFFLCAISFIAAVFLIPSAPLLGLFILAWEILNFSLWIDAIKNSQNESDFNKANAGYAIGAVLGIFEPGVAVAEVVKWFGLLTVLFLTTYL